MTNRDFKRGHLRFFLNIFLFISSFLLMTVSAFGQNLSTRHPANVPSGFIVTPFGYMHPSCITHLREGERASKDMLLHHADGTLDKIPTCQYPRYKANGQMVESTASQEDIQAAAVKQPTISWDWVESVTANYAVNLGEQSSTWVVPPSPTSHDGQTDYFFPGIGNIMQPVMGWGADFKTGWGIASWICCSPAAESPVIQVNPGDRILGTITQDCALGTSACATWKVSITDQTTGKSTTLSAEPLQGRQNEAIGGVLEVYNIVQCSDYPPNGQITFNSTFYDYSGNLVSNLNWSGAASTTDSPQCHYSAHGSGTQITLTYGQAAGIVSGATYTLINPNSGKALDVYGGNNVNGSVVDIWAPNGTNAQKWQINANSDGTYTLVNPNGNLALDDFQSSTTNDSVVDTWAQNGTNAQRWHINSNGDGTYTLVNPNGNLALDVYGAATSNGSKVDLYQQNGTVAQKWQLVLSQ